MLINEFKKNDSSGYFTAYSDENWHQVNPVYKLGMTQQAIMINEMTGLMKLKGVPITGTLQTYIKTKALSMWQNIFQKAAQLTLPEEWKLILEGVSKKEQIKLLANAELTPDSFFNLIIHAWEDYGYTYSRYYFEHRPVDLKTKTYPFFIYKKTQDAIIVGGATNLSESQLKLAVDEKRVNVGHFFDRGDEWFCLFLTYKGIFGKELPHEGSPHMHFTSGRWGISREGTFNMLKLYRYSIPSVHIPFKNYGV